ncbi:DUF1634 domain-containing protein [Filimonas effusa]|uniref:DUF1634 domain-containing protein n=1 Tax=Filimonas effusa TaxID=2508721 RepID=A0A4Q1DB76_9BACT|nr:DUF1634 domain-containing protein [Filimonas effusa]RXK86677.1 DUF1634 domain-containing protein [Filimonas effusa]
MNKPPEIKNRDLQLTLGNLLRIGVILSALLVLAGGIIYIFQQGNGPRPQYVSFTGENSELLQLSDILKGMTRLQGASIIQFGLIVLIATPIARIVISAIGFALEKDYMYLVIAAIVLLIILVSLFSGVAG